MHIFSCVGSGKYRVPGLLRGSRHNGANTQLEAGYRLANTLPTDWVKGRVLRKETGRQTGALGCPVGQ